MDDLFMKKLLSCNFKIRGNNIAHLDEIMPFVNYLIERINPNKQSMMDNLTCSFFIGKGSKGASIKKEKFDSPQVNVNILG